MTFEVKEPVLVIGLGGAGSKLASQAKGFLNSDCLLISDNQDDFVSDCSNIPISTQGIINPSVQSIRGFAFQESEKIKAATENYSTIVMMANLAGKNGSAIAPVVSQIVKEANKSIISFAIMPFKFEKDRIFNSGVALKRVKANSDCTIIIDNDALLESNPDLTAKTCYDIANSAVLHVVNSLKSSDIPHQTSLISTGQATQDLEESLKGSLKMLYENAPPNSVKRSILYVVGGNNVPVGMLNSISTITRGVLNEENARVDIATSSSDESKVVMLSLVQGETRFDKYDPLGIIPEENTLDWETPDCSINCKLDLVQIE